MQVKTASGEAFGSFFPDTGSKTDVRDVPQFLAEQQLVVLATTQRVAEGEDKGRGEQAGRQAGRQAGG